MWRSLAEGPSSRRRRAWPMALAVIAAAAACSKSPSAPDSSSGAYLGEWEGTIVSDEVGPGSLRLSVTSEIGPVATVLIAGTFSISFDRSPLAPRGDFTGNAGTAAGQFGLFFDRSTMPCPSEPGGTAARAIAAVMTVTGPRMAGRFVVAGCPGGAIEISKK